MSDIHTLYLLGVTLADDPKVYLAVFGIDLVFELPAYNRSVTRAMRLWNSTSSRFSVQSYGPVDPCHIKNLPLPSGQGMRFYNLPG